VTLVGLAVLGRGVLPVDTPLLHADDEGVLRGRSVFETLRVYAGTPFKLDEHLDRLAMSAERVLLPPPPRDKLAAVAGEAIAAAAEPDATLRLLWIAGRDRDSVPIGVALVSTLPPDLDAQRARGLRLAVLPWSPGALAGVKSTSYAANMAAQDEAIRAGADDALLVASDGTVLEAPTANVWWREGDTLLTPSLDLPILAGVTRAFLRAVAGREIVEGVFPLARPLAADEVFVCSSVREVMPVASVDGETFGLGPAAHELQRELRNRATC